MTVVTLTPSSTVSSSGIAVTGAANAHSALSDGSDSSYVTFDFASDTLRVALSDLSLPAGAVITRLAAVVRDRDAGAGGSPIVTFTLRVPSGTSIGYQSTVISWSGFTDHTPVVYTAPSSSAVADADVDDAQIDMLLISAGEARIAKASIDVTYVAKPVVDVTAPTGTVSNTNAPTVQWTDTLDSDGGPQGFFEVKIFTDAVYGGGGFNPSISSPQDESGVTNGAATSWAPTDPLPDDTYRAYVRVGQSVLGSDHWSDWDYIEFTITANAPGVPAIHAVADDDDARVWIWLDDSLGATTHAFEVQRSIDAGSTWETIRTLDSGLITPASGVGRAYDTEVGNGVTVRYRARALNIITAFTTYSAWSSSTTPTAWQSASWWLKSASYPDLNIPVELDGLEPLEQEANQGIFGVLGRRLPIVVSDVRSGYRGTIRFVFDDDTERAEFDELLDLREPLLLQAPPTDNWTDRYVMLGRLQRAQGAAKSWIDWTVETLPWTEVDTPTGDVVEWPAFGS